MTLHPLRRATPVGVALALLTALVAGPLLAGSAQDQNAGGAKPPAPAPQTPPPAPATAPTPAPTAPAPATAPPTAPAPAPAAPAPAAPAPESKPAAHGAAAEVAEGEGEGESAEAKAAAAVETGPFARAPLHVPLVIAEPAKVVSPGEKAVDKLAAADPGRFRKEQDHWVDARGEFTWDDDEEIYWQTIPAAVLTRGRQDFVQFCSSCHGLEGDGNGRSGRALRPPPRSFKQSTFKFTKVEAKYLPSDAALVALVKHGLDGTPMLKWEVSDERLLDIVQYIKSLSPEDSGWRDATSEVGDIVETPPDPWAGKEKEALAAGETAYHKNQCYQCHPAYVPAARINEIRGTKDSYPDDLTYSKLKRDSAFEVQGYHVAIPAPDFTWDRVRFGSDATQVYQTIAAGIGGAGMPTWKRAMPDEDIWAIAHYVRHLIDTYRDQPGRAAFMAALRQAH